MSKNCLYAYNIALRRQDGKVEQDTVYRSDLITRKEVEDMATRYSCSVLMSCVGVFKQGTEDFIKENTIFVELPEPKAVDDVDK